MKNNYEIIKSEFITTDYNSNNNYIHWSRIYEWQYVIDELKKIKPKTIHNTACGGLDEGDCLHLTFCRDIDKLCDTAIHSDNWGGGYVGTDTKPTNDNFIHYDITEPYNDKSDVILNISTLEHLPKNKIINALDNLVNQLNVNGHLILTFDYPDIDVKIIEDYFQLKVEKSHNIIKKGNLSVILIHLIKL